MAKITFDQSTREHLAIWQMMRAVDDTGSDRTAWGCRRVISMTSPPRSRKHPGAGHDQVVGT
jgi:hypothetical protein